MCPRIPAFWPAQTEPRPGSCSSQLASWPDRPGPRPGHGGVRNGDEVRWPAARTTRGREKGSGENARKIAELTLSSGTWTGRSWWPDGVAGVLGLRVSASEKNGNDVDFRCPPPVDSSDHDGEGNEEQLPVGFDLLSGSSSGGTTAAGEATVELGGERGGEREQREQGA